MTQNNLGLGVLKNDFPQLALSVTKLERVCGEHLPEIANNPDNYKRFCEAIRRSDVWCFLYNFSAVLDDEGENAAAKFVRDFAKCNLPDIYPEEKVVGKLTWFIIILRNMPFLRRN